MDDDSTGGAPPKESDLHSYALSGKVMCFSVVTLLALLFLILCFHFYNRFLSRRSAAQAQPHRLHPSLLKSVPTFNYSSGVRLDCAVCLSEFQEAETGRILPDCRHCFHIECIDAWFRSHSNCPLCRAPVKPPRVQKSGQIVIRICEYCAGKAGGSDLESAECGCTVTAGVLVPVECGKKSMGVVEEPPWLRSSEPGSGEEGSGTRDPENGTLPPRR